MSGGDCYNVNGALLLFGGGGVVEGSLLCHGTVTGTGGDVKGVSYGHCWIELGDDGALVMDCSDGHDALAWRDDYYAVGNVRDVKRYTVEEARAKVLETGHWGPWE